MKTDDDYQVVVENEGVLADVAASMLAELALAIARERGLLNKKETLCQERSSH